MYDAKQIIELRKEAWKSHNDINTDWQFTERAAQEVLDNESLIPEIQEHPEYLIEMFFVIVDKDKNTVPFFLNEVQRDFIGRINKATEEYKQGSRLNIRFLVLKGRQQGFTSFITAYQLACTITHKNFEGFTAADSDENTSTIFENKAKFPYSQLPDKLKPSEKYNNKKQLLFEKLNSSWEVRTASKNMGRSRTINFFHGSEAAFWKDGISGTQAGLGEALTKNSIQIFESTANGYNEFKDLWDGGKWENCFYEWWRTPEYTVEFESEENEGQFYTNVEKSEHWIFKRCKWLKETMGLSWGQIYWYFNKYDGYLDKDLIKQEYPCTPEEAFIFSGAAVFDQEIIQQRIEHLRQNAKFKCGYFTFEWRDPEYKDKIKDETIKFVEQQSGFIKIYEDKKPGTPYVIGGDTKGEGSDYFTATAINNMTGNRCAVLHADMDPDTYAHQMYCLGKYFNEALIGIEVNFDLYPIKELQRLGYYRQYTRQHYDSKGNEWQKKYGWKTDGNTRPFIISLEIELLRDHPELFNDIEMLQECLTFVKDSNGRPDAMTGKHDDILFSDMIANAIRGQQRADFRLERQYDLPDDLPEDLKRDLIKDPEALKHWLREHGRI